MWKFIVDLCFKLTKIVLTITNLHMDFERGAHEAVKEVFPDINIVGCRFHLAQAWWRKVT
jgi:transposase-like protein